jgi:hypothetical protein
MRLWRGGCRIGTTVGIKASFEEHDAFEGIEDCVPVRAAYLLLLS